MLSSWMRIKYPWALRGAIAASAPIWQFVGLVSPTVYNGIVTRDYQLDTPHCAKGIQKGWDIIEHLSHSKQGLQFLTDLFRPCNISLFNTSTVGSVYGFLSEAFGYMAMVHSPHSAGGTVRPPTPTHLSDASHFLFDGLFCCVMWGCAVTVSGRLSL